MKTLYTAADIETLAVSGQRTLDLAQEAILTPLARDRARELGVQLRWSEETQSHTPRQQPRFRTPVAATGLSSDAQAALISLLQHARNETVHTPHLARCFDALLKAVAQGAPIRPQHRDQPTSLPPEHRQALADKIAQMNALAQYLFGPDSSYRRFDILWALKTINTQLTSNND